MLKWDKALFDELYRGPAWKHGVRGVNRIPSFHYCWFTQKDKLKRVSDNLRGCFAWKAKHNIAIIGGAFGWTVENLSLAGINAISIDIGDYVVSNALISEEQELRDALIKQGFDPDHLDDQIVFASDVDRKQAIPASEMWNRWLHPTKKRTSIQIHHEDIGNNAVHKKIHQQLGNNIHYILTEFLLDAMQTDDESLSMISQCESLRQKKNVQVVHLISGAGGDARLNNKSKEEWKLLLTNNGFQDHFVADAFGNKL